MKADLISAVRSWLYMNDDIAAYEAEHARLCSEYTPAQMLEAIRELLVERMERDHAAMERGER